jgi:hypothetical protein
MKVSTRPVVVLTLVVALAASVTYAKKPDGSQRSWVTGYFLGTFVSVGDPYVGDPVSVGEAAMSVDAKGPRHFSGQIRLNSLVFDIQGTVLVDPPEPDAVLMHGNTPRSAGTPAARIVIRGQVDPPEPDRPAMIEADYMIFFPDGRTDAGRLFLFQVSSR